MLLLKRSVDILMREAPRSLHPKDTEMSKTLSTCADEPFTMLVIVFVCGYDFRYLMHTIMIKMSMCPIFGRYSLEQPSEIGRDIVVDVQPA